MTESAALLCSISASSGYRQLADYEGDLDRTQPECECLVPPGLAR